MEITLTLHDLLMIAVYVALFVLIIYLIKLTKNLCRVAKKTTKILDDVESISSVTTARVMQADEFADKVIGAVGSAVTSVKNQGVAKAASGVAKSVGEIVGLFNCQDKTAASQKETEGEE